MSKYVLAKDLPFAKAGSSVVVLDSPIGRYKRIQVSASIGAPMCELHEDQLCFWVEEVKPREFILAIKEDTREILYNNNYTNADYYYKTYWRGEPRKLPERIKLIKVREVL